jgi:hypothetical protein
MAVGIIEPVIVVTMKDRLTVVAALDHMQNLTGKKITSEPRHGIAPSLQARDCNPMHSTTQVRTLTLNISLT